MPSVLIHAEGISKVYQKEGGLEVHALRDVAVDIRTGEFLAIMGASGSGKTTLMNILGCLDKPTSGSLVLDGTEVSKLDDDALATVRNRKIGFVFQTFNLLPRTNALENVELPLIYSDRSDITERARKALDAVGLVDREHHTPGELSGGQQQRVAIARAIVNDPGIIFADEPTGNLDTQSSVEIMSLFQQLNTKGTTIVVVTHEQDIAEHAGRIVTVSDGRIISDRPNTQPRTAVVPMNTHASTGGDS